MTLITYYLFLSYLHLNGETWGNCYLMCPVKPGRRTYLGAWSLPAPEITPQKPTCSVYGWSWVLNCLDIKPAIVVWTCTIWGQRDRDTVCFWGFFFSILFSILPSLLRNLLFHFLHGITRRHYPLFASASESLNTSQKCALKLQKNESLWARETQRSPRINTSAFLFSFCVMYTSVGEHSSCSREAENTELRQWTSLRTVGIAESEDSVTQFPDESRCSRGWGCTLEKKPPCPKSVYFPKRQRPLRSLGDRVEILVNHTVSW